MSQGAKNNKGNARSYINEPTSDVKGNVNNTQSTYQSSNSYTSETRKEHISGFKDSQGHSRTRSTRLSPIKRSEKQFSFHSLTQSDISPCAEVHTEKFGSGQVKSGQDSFISTPRRVEKEEKEKEERREDKGRDGRNERRKIEISELKVRNHRFI